MSTRPVNIRVATLTRVEGEGALDLDIDGNRVTAVRLRIYEPPRFFEKLLEGRSHEELPDLEARICGICPVAYQLTAVLAAESAFGTEVPAAVTRLRRLLYFGEWIQSHALHIHMLAAPDFLGCSNVFELQAQQPAAVERGMRLQRFGNRLMAWLGGRSVHPVGIRTGGFHRAPPRDELPALRREAETAWADSGALLAWVSTFELPDRHQDFCQVAMRAATGYPIAGGRIVSSEGLDIEAGEFEQHFTEMQVPHSNALQARLAGRPYLVGPLARVNLNLDRVPAEVMAPLENPRIRFPSANPYHAIVARALEIRLAVLEARELLADAWDQGPFAVAVTPRAADGRAATEAPRGLLWHGYRFAADGAVQAARIVPPTSQNQARIEEDLACSLTAFGLDRDEAELRQEAERIIRNYDPCISCATHFLDLRVHRRA